MTILHHTKMSKMFEMRQQMENGGWGLGIRGWRLRLEGWGLGVGG